LSWIAKSWKVGFSETGAQYQPLPIDKAWLTSRKTTTLPRDTLVTARTRYALQALAEEDDRDLAYRRAGRYQVLSQVLASSGAEG
jgi:hypothetical protein